MASNLYSNSLCENHNILYATSPNFSPAFRKALIIHSSNLQNLDPRKFVNNSGRSNSTVYGKLRLILGFLYTLDRQASKGDGAE